MNPELTQDVFEEAVRNYTLGRLARRLAQFAVDMANGDRAVAVEIIKAAIEADMKAEKESEAK